MFKTGNGGSMDGIPALGANLAVITSGTGTLTTSVTTATEISYVSGVTSSIQTQLNGKQASGNYITALTGDVTATGPGSVAATLATVLGTPGVFPASAAQIPSITVNAKGLITAISSVNISLPFSQVTGTVPLNQGGTGQTTKAAGFDALSPMTTIGDIIYGGASGTGTRLPNGTTGQFLGANTGAAPSWKNLPAYHLEAVTTAGQSIPNTGATIVWGTAVSDPNSMLNTITGVITVPVAGKWLMVVGLEFASSVVNVGAPRFWQFYKNGAVVRASAIYPLATRTDPFLLTASYTYNLTATDTVEFFINANESGSRSLSTSALTNWITFTRISD